MGERDGRSIFISFWETQERKRGKEIGFENSGFQRKNIQKWTQWTKINNKVTKNRDDVINGVP